MTLALISLISAVLGTCIAVFAAGVALAFWPRTMDKPKKTHGRGRDSIAADTTKPRYW
jgi:hypothetical protein